MGKNLRGGYKLIPLLIDLALASASITLSGIYASIKSTKKRIVLTGLLINGVVQNDIAVKVDEDESGLHIYDIYGYDLLIASNDSVTVSEHDTLSVVANPTLAGTEADLNGLEVDGIKYKVGGGSKLYLHVCTVPFSAGGSDVSLETKIVTTKDTAYATADDILSDRENIISIKAKMGAGAVCFSPLIENVAGDLALAVSHVNNGAVEFAVVIASTSAVVTDTVSQL